MRSLPTSNANDPQVVIVLAENPEPQKEPHPKFTSSITVRIRTGPIDIVLFISQLPHGIMIF
jgi:hypothetical protein